MSLPTDITTILAAATEPLTSREIRKALGDTDSPENVGTALCDLERRGHVAVIRDERPYTYIANARCKTGKPATPSAGGVLLIAEGCATAASLHEATGLSVANARGKTSKPAPANGRRRVKSPARAPRRQPWRMPKPRPRPPQTTCARSSISTSTAPRPRPDRTTSASIAPTCAR